MTAESELQNVTLSEEFYRRFMDEGNLTDEWILTRTPIPILVIITLYLLVVLKLGPMYMEGRSPYKLKLIMRLYNIIQVVCNFCILYKYLVPRNGIIPLPYLAIISCSVPSSFEGIEDLKYMFLLGGWCFVVLKILDLLDTVFMVLRKKTSHITFLHVYHHGAMVFFTWFTLSHIKATQGAIPTFINLLVHTLLYSYYFLATFRSLKKYLWWKRHLTTLQLTQFAVILAYICLLYYNNCPISSQFTYIWAFNVFVILCLFINFYVKSYILKSSAEQKEDIAEKKIT